jgi:uncharacterized membrane protein
MPQTITQGVKPMNNTTMNRFPRMLPLLLVLASLPSMAQAQMTFCNKASSRVASAIGYKAENGQWTAEGWYILDPQECKVVLAGPLTNRYYYAYAQAGSKKYKGDHSFCVHPNEAFTAADSDDCGSRGYRSEGFAQIDSGQETNFTFEFIDSSTPLPPPVTPASHPDICRSVRMGPKTFDVVVKTGTPAGAGTDSTISLKLVGNPDTCSNSTESGWIDLNPLSDRSDAFVNGEIDNIVINDGPNLSPTGIQLKSDGRWSGPAWYCEWVSVNGTRFNVNSWIEYGKVYNFR